MSKPKKPKVIVEAGDVFYVHIKDKSNEAVSKFMSWKMENDIFALRLGGMSGGGMYSGFFSMDDKEKVINFLESL